MPEETATLTARQAEVLREVDHYHREIGRPAPAAIVAERLGMTHQRVKDIFKRLFGLGWLRGPGSPAIPAREVPPTEALRETQLCETDDSADRDDVPQQELASRRYVDMPPLAVRAAVQSVDPDARTVELIFTTGAAVERYDWWTDKRYLEVLSLDEGAVRLGRLDAGAPVLDSHSGWGVGSILGITVENSAKLTRKDGRVTARFSRRADVEPVWQDIRDGIVKNVSVGYRIYKFVEEQGKGNALPTRTATDWEPFEVSMVPIPADAGAQVRARSGKAIETNRCEVETREIGAARAAEVETNKPETNEPAGRETPAPEKETIMPDETRAPQFIAEERERRPAAKPAAPIERNDRDIGAEDERARVQGILSAVRAARLPVKFADDLIAEGLSLVDAQSRVFAELSKRDMQSSGPQPGGAGTRVEVLGDDPLVHERAGVIGALCHRVMPEQFKLEDSMRPYRGLSLMDTAEIFLRATGMRITGMSKSERALAALAQRSGMHTVSDFPSLLADVASKILRAAYEEAQQTWRPLAKLVNRSDFKSSNLLQVGEAPALEEVLEHGEYKSGTIAEGKETIRVRTYGKIFAITRQALINDDTGAFAEVPAGFGRSARTLESNLAWAIITSNPTMGDGNALFDSANHGNLTGSGTAISVDSLGVARSKLRLQKGLDGVTPLNLAPRYLIVPAGKETVADQYVTQITPAQGSNANPFMPGGRTPLTVIAEPRLDAASATAWYLATDSTSCPVINYAILDGQIGPTISQQIGFRVDGLEIKCSHDVGFGAADWHGIIKNVGA